MMNNPLGNKYRSCLIEKKLPINVHETHRDVQSVKA